jgi:hypothetical protein
MKSLLMIAACALALPAAADDKPPVPKVYRGMGTQQKGQWKVDILETSRGGGDRKPPSMTICTDNLHNQAGQGPSGAARMKPECKYRVLKDTASEAIVESTCKDHTMTVKTTRENDKTLLMEMDGKAGSGSPTHMKMRYAYLGPCREGQGAMTFDKDSEQCRKIRQQAAQLDPEKQCARSAQRERCLQQMQQRQKQMAAMCS